jgi:hypothetical protein
MSTLTHDIGVDLSKRTFLKVGGIGGLGLLVGGTTACPGDKKKVSFFVVTITGSMQELKPLLPAQEALLSKAIDIANAFNNAYQAGKFDSAIAAFENLVGVINEIIAAAGVGVSDSVKIALAVSGVAVRGIAVLLRDSTADPVVATVVREKMKTSEASAKQASLVESLSSSKEINAVLEAAKP